MPWASSSPPRPCRRPVLRWRWDAGCSSSLRCERAVSTRSTLRARAHSGGRRVLASLWTWRSSRAAPTLQAVARRRGVGAIGHHCCSCSTHNPPHEQLLVRLGVRGVSSFVVVALPPAPPRQSSSSPSLPHCSLLLLLVPRRPSPP